MDSVADRAGLNEVAGVIRVEEDRLRRHVDEVVRSSVEATLNELLDAEADRLCQAKRYERSADRVDTRAGSYERQLQTKAGEVTLKVPRLRSLAFETQIIERYRRRESSVAEALMAQGRRASAQAVADELMAGSVDGRADLRCEGMLVDARIRLSMGERPGAIVRFREACAQFPKDAAALHELARVLFDDADRTACLETLERLAKLAPDDPSARHNLGTALLRIGRATRAADELEEAMRLRPDHAPTREHLAAALESTGRQKDADRVRAGVDPMKGVRRRRDDDNGAEFSAAEAVRCGGR